LKPDMTPGGDGSSKRTKKKTGKLEGGGVKMVARRVVGLWKKDSNVRRTKEEKEKNLLEGGKLRGSVGVPRAKKGGAESIKEGKNVDRWQLETDVGNLRAKR